jgi:molybdate transport system substrate-binding protein
MRHVLVAAMVLQIGLPSPASALVVLSAGTLEAGVRQLAAQFERETGNSVRIEIGNAPQLTARLAAGSPADVLIAPAAVVDQAIADQRVVGRSRTPVGRVGVAVVVRAGAARPDVASPDGLRRALLEADAVIYNQGSSGAYIDRLLRDLGVADRIAPKAFRVLNGEAVMERLAGGRGSELAFLAMSDAIRAAGVQYVGPLPASLQNYTRYDAAIMAGASEAAAAETFIRYITTPPAKRTLEAAGVVP